MPVAVCAAPVLGICWPSRLLSQRLERLIIYGCIRDVDQIRATDIGVQALGVHPMKTDKKGVGELNIPVTFGGVTFAPKDYVYADNNGIILSAEPLA